MTEDEKTKILAARIVFGIFGLFGLLIIYGLIVGRNAPQLTQQDLFCRQLIRDGQGSKTQAEFDFAKKKFVENCDGWTDPLEKK